MSLFGLDPESVVARCRSSLSSFPIPTLAQSVCLGSLGFCGVSLVVYGIWAFSGSWMYRHLGEAGFYALCAAVFISLSGLGLHRLIIGPGSLSRFFGIFALGFFTYAVSWCVAWFIFRGKLGEWIGSLMGSITLGLVIARAFSAPRTALPIICFLFVAHSLGYFLGELLYDFSNSEAARAWLGSFMSNRARGIASKLLWGALYGLGLGAGLGYAFYTAQEEPRARLKQTPASNPNVSQT